MTKKHLKCHCAKVRYVVESWFLSQDCRASGPYILKLYAHQSLDSLINDNEFLVLHFVLLALS